LLTDGSNIVFKDGETMKALRVGLLGLFTVLCLLSSSALAEVGVGMVHSTDELNQVRSKWKLQMVSTRDRQDKDYRVTQRVGSYERSDVVTKKGKTHGCLIWCVLPPGADKNAVEIKYSYSYGEPSADAAAKKAAYAFDSQPGTCERGKPAVEYGRGDDF
jgi:hypothetical protein